MDANATTSECIETDSEKYHPSILQNTAHKHISGIIDRIDPQKKYAFLEILQNTFRSILSCFKCKSLLSNTSSAFNCGHKYCERCSVNLDKCPTCKDNGKIRAPIKDFSNILNIINEIKSDFNSDRVIYEVIRFLLFGSAITEPEEEMDEASTTVNNHTPPILSQSRDESLKKSRKLASKIKKQKTPLNKGENSRKKLKFDKTSSSPQTSVTHLENDSENLFMEIANNRKSCARKDVSYLETQPALSEINAGGSSSSKRKRGTDIHYDSSVENVKRAKNKTDSESSPMEVDSDKRRVSVRLTRYKVDSESSSPDLQNQGTFYGFTENEIGNSDQKLTKWKKCILSKRLKRNFTPVKPDTNSKIVEISIGEKKLLHNVPQKKSNSMLEAVKSTVGEMQNDVKIENALATVRDADTEELDLDVWKRNDINDKKKRLFKSVKERNKRDVSISGTLDNILVRQKLVTERKTTSNIRPQAFRIEIKNTPENRSFNDQTASEEHSTITKTSPKTDEIPITNQPQINQQQKQIQSKPKKSISKKITKDAKNVKPTEIIISEVVIPPPPPPKIQTTEKIISPAKISLNESTPSENPSTTTVTENLPINKPADVNSSPNNTEKPEPNTSKLGLPLFPDPLDPDIFSQKNAICSSTPCGPTKFKVTKTYSRVKSKLFDKTIADISPIIEREPERSENLKYQPKISPLRKKFASPTLENLVIKSPMKVQVEIHRVPNIPPVKVNEPNQIDEILILKNKTVESPIRIATDSEAITVENTSAKSPMTGKPDIDVHAVPNEVAAFLSPYKTPENRPDSIEHLPISVPNCNHTCTEGNEITAMEVDQIVDNVAKEMISKITPQKMQVEEPSTPQKQSSETNRKNRIKEIQDIGSKNEKSLFDLKKNFNHISPKLAIEKVKNSIGNTSLSSKSPDQEAQKAIDDRCEQISAILTEPKEPEIQSPQLSDYDDGTPTQRFPTPRKDVACQTCDDLLEDLFKEKFAHLFEKPDPKSDYPLSIYDTPSEQNNDAAIAKTPDVSAANITAKYTLISSVTSSEKKFADKHFVNDSVLCDSPFTVGSANKTGNVSGYAPLTPEHRTEEKNKLSCRLNFITDTDDLLANFVMDDDVPRDHVKSPSVRTNSDDEQVLEELTRDGSGNAVNLGDDKVEENILQPHESSVEVTNRSDEIIFNDSMNDKIQEVCDRVEQQEVVGSASILENTKIDAIEVSHHEQVEDGDKTFFESDSVAVVPDTEPAVLNDNSSHMDSDVKKGILCDKIIKPDNNEKPDDDKIISDDEDDVDFVAGTPTSQPRRFIGATLEKNRTPRKLLDQILQTPLSNLSIRQNTTPYTSSIHPLTDISQFSVVKNPNPVTNVTPTFERQKDEDSGRISAELLNSDVLPNSPSFESIRVSTSGLKEPDIKVIKKFCQKFAAFYSDKLTDTSTHLVVKIDENNRTARTFKFLQAIVTNVRIVSMDWIHECLAKNKIVDEAKFIPLDSSGECGPLRTFHVLKRLTPSPLSWLHDYCVYFTEPVPEECTLEQLQLIMRKAGATVANSLSDFKKYPNHHHIIIVSDEDDDDENEENEEKNTMSWNVAAWYKTYQAVAIEFNWMLEVIGRNKMVPFADYEVREYPPEYLLSINFPAEMLKSDEDSQKSE